jgi:hypothetical protein
MIAAVAALRRETWVDSDHVILLGHSTGALAVTAAAASTPPGVVGIVNFDGGRHAPSETGEACAPEHVVNTFAALGREVRIPSLWLYAENDRSYGPDLAHRMFEAYAAGGAAAELKLLPPFSSDGHDLITRAAEDIWLPSVAPFLAGLGLPTAPIVTLPQPAELPPPKDLAPVCREVFAQYLAYRSDAKAFAASAKGACGSGIGRTIEEARSEALAVCEGHARGTPCTLYAVGQHLAGQ